MKKINYVIFVLSLFLFNFNIIKANEINNINVNVELDENGNGLITEIWDIYANEGTEIYKSFGNLENSQISNFKVIDESGREYTLLTKWNTIGTLSSKAYKNGINYTSNGLELCWGISSYGNHRYTIIYNVSNMIYNVNDAQILYWKFINDLMEPTPKNFSVTVNGPKYYENTLDVWGYGYKGYAYVYDGIISMSNVEDKNFKSNEYAVLLVKYPINTFKTNNRTDKYATFKEVLNLAKKGSFKQDYEQNSNKIKIIIISTICIVTLIIIIILIIKHFKKVNADLGLNNNYIRKNIDYRNVNYFREIPCDKDVFKVFFLTDVYSLSSKRTDLFGAIILKWLMEGKAEVVVYEKKKLFSKRSVKAIDLRKFSYTSNASENELYDIMMDASKDGLLEQYEIEKWCSNYHSKFFKWFDKTLEYMRKQYSKTGNLLPSSTYANTYILDDVLYSEALKLAGLKRYLKEFSQIHEKQPMEVKIWQEYLIYAQIFGIAREVAYQFKNLYPELITNKLYGFNLNDIIWVDNITSRGINLAKNPRDRFIDSRSSDARQRATNYSSGGGGFSSGGGGGGSFGGGSGGGIR